jgi:DNA repair protein RecO (recombination protein O)
MLQKTKGMVLRGVKYGETSLIVTIFTEMLGIQSYLVNGVRSATLKNPYRAGMFQPATLLDMVVYHSDRSNLHRIREFRLSRIYTDIYKNVHKNTVALFMVELLQKCLKQPEANPVLYEFIEDAFVHLDESDSQVAANFPLYFTLHLAHFFGFRIQDDYSEENSVLDLQEGGFVEGKPMHPNFLEGNLSVISSSLLKAQHPDDLKSFFLSREQRYQLLDAYLSFYAFHQPDFGTLRSLPILHTLYEI